MVAGPLLYWEYFIARNALLLGKNVEPYGLIQFQIGKRWHDIVIIRVAFTKK